MLRSVSKPNRETTRRLLGIDPGTHLAGWAIIEAQGMQLKMIACGVAKPALPKQELSIRLRDIFERFEEVIAEFKPQAAAIEETFAGPNPKSAIAMGQGRGVAMLALARAGIPVMELAPNEIKKALTGNGLAKKDQVARMVCARLRMTEIPKPEDITDALAIAIALSHRI